MKLSLNTKSLKGISYGTTLRPSRDWLVLVSVIFVCLLISVGWNLWTFNKVTQGGSVGTGTAPEQTGAPAFDGVTNLFEQRAAEEGRYRNEYRFVDPSR